MPLLAPVYSVSIGSILGLRLDQPRDAPLPGGNSVTDRFLHIEFGNHIALSGAGRHPELRTGLKLYLHSFQLCTLRHQFPLKSSPQGTPAQSCRPAPRRSKHLVTLGLSYFDLRRQRKAPGSKCSLYPPHRQQQNPSPRQGRPFSPAWAEPSYSFILDAAR